MFFVSVLAAVQLALLRTTPPGWSVADKSLIVICGAILECADPVP